MLVISLPRVLPEGEKYNVKTFNEHKFHFENLSYRYFAKNKSSYESETIRKINKVELSGLQCSSSTY